MAVVLSAVPMRNFRIPFLPVTLQTGCSDADKPKRARSRHQPLPGKAFPAACHGMRGARTIFLSDPHGLRRNADTPEPADVFEAGNCYRYYAGGFDGATENEAAIDGDCAIIVSQKSS